MSPGSLAPGRLAADGAGGRSGWQAAGPGLRITCGSPALASEAGLPGATWCSRVWNPGSCGQYNPRRDTGDDLGTSFLSSAGREGSSVQLGLCRLGPIHLSPAGRTVSLRTKPSCQGGGVGQGPGSLSGDGS